MIARIHFDTNTPPGPYVAWRHGPFSGRKNYSVFAGPSEGRACCYMHVTDTKDLEEVLAAQGTLLALLYARGAT